jgi:uncharacterized membrane protein YfcA
LGVVIGFLGGLYGIGGGVIAIPLLGILYGFDEQHAQGTAIAMVIPNVFVGLWQYARRARMSKRIVLALAIPAAPFTFWAAHVATHVPSAPLRRSAYYVWRALRENSAAAAAGPHLERWPYAIPIGALGGTLSGLFSVGGAFFAVPVVAYVFGLSQAVAQGFGLALVVPGTFISLATYAAAGDVAWRTGVALAVGGIVAVGWGVRVAHDLPERTMRLLFALMATSAAVLLWVRA